MPTLASHQRKALEKTVHTARQVAELGVRGALTSLAVSEPNAFSHHTDTDAALRTRLRKRAREVGSGSDEGTPRDVAPLVEEIAYEHWHRMLFARFLAENNLLIHPAFGAAVSIKECKELAADDDQYADGWALAAHCAAAMLPEIFRNDALAFELQLAREHRTKLERLVEGLNQEVFTSTDGLGWVYQFWQAERKKEVNDSGVKIGARELPAVTQLFTEPYMVSFLLDNALGAWWAGRRLSPKQLAEAANEDELRRAAAIPGVPLDYLRFVRTGEEGDGPWTPAAGTFEGWPESLAELSVLDPCCGSGHFLVAVLRMLVPMRIKVEGLSPKQAIDAVLTENLHGLELDQRCVEIAVFAVALEAWRYEGAGDYRKLPTIRIACSGRAPSADQEAWDTVAKSDPNLRIALKLLYEQFKDAPTLGSLIDPGKAGVEGLGDWAEISAALQHALQENGLGLAKDTAVAAQGLAEAAELLSGKYTWVVTNVPYLGSGKQSAALNVFCEKYYDNSKSDLATVFLERCVGLLRQACSASLVLPQNWLFLWSYRFLRKDILVSTTWNVLARLGPGAFREISGEVVKAVLLTLSNTPQAGPKRELFAAAEGHVLRGLDVSDAGSADEKATALVEAEVASVSQAGQLGNPDARVVLGEAVNLPLLRELASGLQGLSPADAPRFSRQFHEIDLRSEEWRPWQSSTTHTDHFCGKNLVLWDSKGLKDAAKAGKAYIRGAEAWGRASVVISQMSSLPSTLGTGAPNDTNCATVLPHDEERIEAIWCFCASPQFHDAVREIDQKLNVTNATLVKVPFDLPHWQSVAQERYPNGLPEPYTNDPTQWLFHGHPCGSVIWDEETKWTANGDLREDDTVLQVAVARLLGYCWPAELDEDMHLAEEQRAWVVRCDELLPLADEDGIVCLPPISGERDAASRLQDVLRAAYGDAFDANTVQRLLLATGHKGGMEKWLRDKFFKEHCKLFGNRPFIWHIWDGQKDGFSALVNYHKLDYKGLQSLIHRYLADWITAQRRAEEAGVDGAATRRNAAEGLKRRLEQILEGDAPYDIFVRWKSLEEQPVGWRPDLNDGVRLNIRPFLKVGDVDRKGAGVLCHKVNVHWKNDRGKDVEGSPWYHFDKGVRVNDRHLGLGEKGVMR